LKARRRHNLIEHSGVDEPMLAKAVPGTVAAESH
jgi:hypothetical protein